MLTIDMRYPEYHLTKDSEHKHKYQHPDKESLEKLLWSKPTIEVAKELGVSDKAIEKLAKKLYS